MKAIRFGQYGEPAQVLTVQECPLPEPGKGEVRVAGRGGQNARLWFPHRRADPCRS